MDDKVIATLPLTENNHKVLLHLFNKSLMASAQTNEGIAAAELVTMLRGLIVPEKEDSDGTTGTDQRASGTDVSDS